MHPARTPPYTATMRTPHTPCTSLLPLNIALLACCSRAGFYSLIHSSIPSAELATLGFDYSYGNILSTMLLWLSGQVSLGMITPLSSFSAETMLSAELS